MDTQIFVDVGIALITGLCVALPTIYSAKTTSSKNQALLTYRLDKLEEKVELHNHVVQRVAVLEAQIKEISREHD